MSMSLSRVGRVALLAGTAVIAWPALAQEAPGAVADDRGTLEEIVVTAQKREENLQRVPVAVTAFSADTVRETRIQTTRDLNALAPGLSVQQTPGGSVSASYSLRGINATASFPGTSPGVALYVDGVYYGTTVGAFSEVADVARIEVLRGPQGTLFGRNATGGAISITTRNPSGQFAVHQELTYGNYDQFRSKTRVDLPAWGALSLSGTYLHSERRGDIRNLGAGQQWDYGPSSGGNFGIKTSPKYLGNQNVESFAGSALYDPGSGITLLYKFDYSENDYTDNGQGLAGFTNSAGGPFIGSGAGVPLGLLYYFGNPLAGVAGQPEALRTPITLKRPDAVNNSFTTPGHARTYGHNLTATWNINDTFTVKNIFAYRNTQVKGGTANVDGFGFAVAGPASFISPAFAGQNVATLIGVNTNSRFHQYSNETQINITTDGFEVTGGFIYYNDRSTADVFANAAGFGTSSGIFTTTAAQGTTGPIVVSNQGFRASSTYSRSNALYVQGTFHIFDRLDLVAGVRQTWDRKGGRDNFNRAQQFIIDYRDDRPNWAVSLNYRPDDNILTYVKAGTGFISGGQLGAQAQLIGNVSVPVIGPDGKLVPNTFAPETVKSYEAGVKADLFDRRVRTNIAVYHADYKNIQFPTTVQGQNFFGNAGDARAQGVEFEGTVIPFPGLTVAGNVGYLDFKYKNFNPITLAAACPVSDRCMFTVHNRPKWTGTLNATYETPEMSWGGHVRLRGETVYKGHYFSSFRGVDDGDSSVAGDAFEDGKFDSNDDTYRQLHRRTQWLFNARLAVTDIPVGPAKAELAVWGKNLSNNREPQFMTYFGFGTAQSFERARTYGVDLTIDF